MNSIASLTTALDFSPVRTVPFTRSLHRKPVPLRADFVFPPQASSPTFITSSSSPDNRLELESYPSSRSRDGLSSPESGWSSAYSSDFSDVGSDEISFDSGDSGAEHSSFSRKMPRLKLCLSGGRGGSLEGQPQVPNYSRSLRLDTNAPSTVSLSNSAVDEDQFADAIENERRRLTRSESGTVQVPIFGNSIQRSRRLVSSDFDLDVDVDKALNAVPPPMAVDLAYSLSTTSTASSGSAPFTLARKASLTIEPIPLVVPASAPLSRSVTSSSPASIISAGGSRRRIRADQFRDEFAEMAADEVQESILLTEADSAGPASPCEVDAHLRMKDIENLAPPQSKTPAAHPAYSRTSIVQLASKKKVGGLKKRFTFSSLATSSSPRHSILSQSSTMTPPALAVDDKQPPLLKTLHTTATAHALFQTLAFSSLSEKKSPIIPTASSRALSTAAPAYYTAHRDAASGQRPFGLRELREFQLAALVLECDARRPVKVKHVSKRLPRKAISPEDLKLASESLTSSSASASASSFTPTLHSASMPSPEAFICKPQKPTIGDSIPFQSTLGRSPSSEAIGAAVFAFLASSQPRPHSLSQSHVRSPSFTSSIPLTSITDLGLRHRLSSSGAC